MWVWVEYGEFGVPYALFWSTFLLNLVTIPKYVSITYCEETYEPMRVAGVCVR